MSFDTTARQRVAPGAEEQEMPACLPMVSSTGDERATMTEQELDNEISGMWSYLRQQGDMVSDAPARKIGMPWVAPYEGVCFPVEIDGRFSVVSIDAEQVARFAAALVAAIPRAIKLEQECDAEIAAHEAINKAKGEE